MQGEYVVEVVVRVTVNEVKTPKGKGPTSVSEEIEDAIGEYTRGCYIGDLGRSQVVSARVVEENNGEG